MESIRKLKQEIKKNNDWEYFEELPEKFLTSQRLKNYILSREEEGRKELRLKSLPYHFVIEPTNICNLACPLCSTGLGSKSRPKGVLSLDNYKKIIDACKDYVLKIYLQNWGEPTLVRHLPEMITYAASANIWTHVSTNFSQKYQEGYLEKLLTSGLAVLQADLDATTQEVYVTYRRRGNLEQVISNIKEAVRIKKEKKLELPVIETVMMVMSHNEHQIKDYKKLAQSLGVDKYDLGRIQLNPNTSLKWLPKNEEYTYQTYRGQRITNPCHWPWSGLVINWDGGISPCCIVDDKKADFGNLFDQEMAKLWNNDCFVSARSTFSCKKEIKRPTICNICKNDMHNPKLKRFSDSFSLTL